MKHIRALSNQKPATAQFEPILQLVGLIQSVLGLPSVLIQEGTQILSALMLWQQLSHMKTT